MELLTWACSLLGLNLKTFIIAILVYALVMVIRSPKNLPPGPRGIPILGALPLLGKTPHLTALSWTEKYGDLISLYMGSRLAIILNSYELVHECLVRQGEVFAGRPWMYLRKLTKDSGLFFTDGEPWREHRRFTVACLRDFGMGRRSMEEKIQEELLFMLDEVSTARGQPFDIHHLLRSGVSNIICLLVYGSRFNYDDKIFQENLKGVTTNFRGQKMTKMINVLPFLEFLPKLLPEDKSHSENVKMRDEYAAYQLANHQVSYQDENPRDYIDAYLDQLKKKKEKGEETSMSENQLKRCIQDLFIAGSETVSTTLQWGILLLALYPDVQEKMRDEISEVVGQDRMPSMQDRAYMPYTEATILEIMRRGTISALGVPRATLQDTQVSGYHIPKGTWVFVNRWALSMGTRYWDKPEDFNPLRFINDEKKVKKLDYFVPFGVGIRNCAGEALAKMEVFQFLTGLLQRFTFRIPEGDSRPSLEPRVGLNLSPEPYSIIAEPNE